jgi:hypothetical protein
MLLVVSFGLTSDPAWLATMMCRPAVLLSTCARPCHDVISRAATLTRVLDTCSHLAGTPPLLPHMHTALERSPSCAVLTCQHCRAALTAGYYVNADNVPAALRWLPAASLIKQAFEALCINEFSGMEFEADEKGSGMRDGQAVLQWLGFADGSVLRKMGHEARILLFYYWLCYNILKAGKPRFQEMVKEEEEEEGEKSEGVASGQAPQEAVASSS